MKRLTVDEVLKQLGEAKAEIREQGRMLEHRIKAAQDAKRDLASSEKANADLQGMRLRMYDSLMLEKVDLMGRIARIDQRIAMLGLAPAGRVDNSLELKKMAEHAARVTS